MPKFCRKKAEKSVFFTILITWNMRVCRKHHSRQTRTLYGWNESKTSTDRPHLCTPYGVKFTYFDQKWPKILVFWEKNYHTSAIKWCKAVTLWHSLQSIIVLLENESPNNREYLSVWPPQRDKYPYFDPKIPEILAFC